MSALETGDPTSLADGPLGPIQIAIPADHRSVRVARVASGAAAAHLDADVEGLEDLHLAVGEACAVLLGCATPAAEQPDRLELTIRAHPTELRVRAERPFARLVEAPSELSVAILDSVCERWKLVRGPVMILVWRPSGE